MRIALISPWDTNPGQLSAVDMLAEMIRLVPNGARIHQLTSVLSELG